MIIDIIAPGKIREKYLNEGIGEYVKRLRGYCTINIIEVRDERIPENAGLKDEEQVRNKEGERILRHLKEGCHIIALDIKGEQMSSENMSQYMHELFISGRSHIVFIIGGSLGLSGQVLNKACLRLSFSRLTFHHQLMRVILLEQIYRCFKIIKGEPYHK